MTAPVLLCTDGSELSLAALREGHRLLDPDSPRVVVTVINPPDEADLVGSGHAGPATTPERFEADLMRSRHEADDALTKAAAAIGVPDSHRVLEGPNPGTAIVELAGAEGATAIVVGSHGHGGLKRAVLGSVSDHLVRNAPCPVVVVPAAATD